MIGFAKLDEITNNPHQVGTRHVKTIQGTCLDQQFKGLFSNAVQIHTLRQISQVLEFTAGLTFLDEILKDRNTNALDGTQSKTNAGLAHNIKLDVAAIDIRRQNLEFHAPAFRQVPDDFIRLVQVARHDGGHVLFRKVCLQVRRLITN